MLKHIYSGLAIASEILLDFIIYIRKNLITIIMFLLFSASLLAFMVRFLCTNANDIVVNIIAGFISIPIVYFVIKFFFMYGPKERTRLMNDFQECVDFYKDSGLDFIKYRGKEYPSIIFYSPEEQAIKLKDIDVEAIDEAYILPDSIRYLYEPIEAQIKKRFLDEGLFNMPKARVINFNVDKDSKRILLEVQRTYYYYSFITNFFADYNLFNNRVTLRQVYKDEFVNNIKSLNKEITSNHLGFGGFIITCDGKIPLFLRKSNVAVSSRMLGNTFNGSVDWYGVESLHKSVFIELKEEVGIDVDDMEILLIGIERNILWLGKTDLHLIIFWNKNINELNRKISKSKTNEENVRPITIDLGIPVNSLEDLAQNKDVILTSLNSQLEILEKKYKLSLPLISGLHLFENFIRAGRNA